MNFNIQMRWLVTGDGHEDTPTEKELQFRILADGHSAEWQDVPSVSWRDQYIGDE